MVAQKAIAFERYELWVHDTLSSPNRMLKAYQTLGEAMADGEELPDEAYVSISYIALHDQGRDYGSWVRHHGDKRWIKV